MTRTGSDQGITAASCRRRLLGVPTATIRRGAHSTLVGRRRELVRSRICYSMRRNVTVQWSPWWARRVSAEPSDAWSPLAAAGASWRLHLLQSLPPRCRFTRWHDCFRRRDRGARSGRFERPRPTQARNPGVDSDDLLLLEDLLGIADPDVELPRIDAEARRRRLTALVNCRLADPGSAGRLRRRGCALDRRGQRSMIADFLAVIPGRDRWY